MNKSDFSDLKSFRFSKDNFKIDSSFQRRVFDEYFRSLLQSYRLGQRTFFVQSLLVLTPCPASRVWTAQPRLFHSELVENRPHETPEHSRLESPRHAEPHFVFFKRPVTVANKRLRLNELFMGNERFDEFDIFDFRTQNRFRECASRFGPSRVEFEQFLEMPCDANEYKFQDVQPAQPEQE